MYQVDPKLNEARRAVVTRDDDLLTPEDISGRWQMCCDAMMKELHTWVKHQNIPRKPRREAGNVIDTRWVMQCKYEQSAASVEYMRAGKKADTQRIVRARLFLRGFKDMRIMT